MRSGAEFVSGPHAAAVAQPQGDLRVLGRAITGWHVMCSSLLRKLLPEILRHRSLRAVELDHSLHRVCVLRPPRELLC